MDSLAAVLKRDRLIVGTGVLVVSGLAWWHVVASAQRMGGPAMQMSGPDPNAWPIASLAPLFLMWIVMMVAMMLPSAAPMILTFARVARNRRQHQRPYVPVAFFASGYFVVWGGFSAVATLAQWYLHRAALISSMMVAASALPGGMLLLLAGIFQFAPLKRTCLARCRAPLEFIMMHWREGRSGAFVMGLEHGLFCTGCCWALMALLFVLGVMNLLWIAVLTVLVGLEKISPWRLYVSRGTGLLLALWGLWVIFR